MVSKTRLSAGTLIVMAGLVMPFVARAGNQVLWYEQPAKNWEKEALPLGNGRLGCKIFGDTNREQIQFNEDSLWVGDEKDTGGYQAFGDLYIDLDHKDVTHYRRELDISKSIHTVSYTCGQTTYTREAFASHPAQVLVFRFTADAPGAYTGKISMTDAHKGTVRCQDNQISIAGDTEGYVIMRGGKPKSAASYDFDLDYEARIQVLHSGGTLATKADGIAFANCDSVTILLAADTNYLNQRDKGWMGEHPHQRIASQLATAAKRPFEDLKQEHLQDYRRLFDRLTLDLGATDPEVLQKPTDARVRLYKEGGKDSDLEELLYQYARYLMISSSRKGALPANLQGLWNMSNNPAWRGDYHSDLNVQMNYWFVDQANLSECFSPYSEWLNSIIPVRREDTRETYGVRGWMTRSANGICGGATYHWVPGDSAWLAQNIWDHYAFTRDEEYLKTRAYPIIKELCELWEDYLIEKPDGTLVSPASISPEHGPKAEGNSYEQQLVWDLFTNYIEASKALGVDEAYRQNVSSMRDRLLGPQIGKWGQLQEWAEDIDDPNDDHRHISHMIAILPGRQISPTKTPKLAEAAKVSIKARGIVSTSGEVGWAHVWKIALWARLHDSQMAHLYLNRWISSNVFVNLWNACWPGRIFQIDANFGYACGVGEMLLQSHTGEIHLLPALPAAWPNGSVHGIRARGNVTVDIEWKDGKVTNYRITSPEPKEVTVRVNGEAKTVVAGMGGYATQPKLLVTLPDHANTPDGCTLDRSGNIILSLPNFNNKALIAQGVIKQPSPAFMGVIDKENGFRTWYEFKPADLHPETGNIGPMDCAFGPDGHLYLADNQLFDNPDHKSRILRIVIKDGKPVRSEVVVEGYNCANGTVWHGDTLYVSETILGKTEDKKLISGVYRFTLMELQKGCVKLKPYSKGAADPHLISEYVTSNRIGFGADGVACDAAGSLYCGIFEDGIIYKTTFDKNGKPSKPIVFANDEQMHCCDGIIWREKDNCIYVTDMLRNAVQIVDMQGNVRTLHRNGDTDGTGGELDQPCEVLERGDELIVINMDMPWECDILVNTKIDTPYTVSTITLP